jgi:mannose-P-dolichol utilization defect protein 1
MELFEKITSLIMTQKCFEEIFIEYNFTNFDCYKMVLSKCLGYSIIAGSVLLRVPQILKIISIHSARGISLLSEFLAVIAVFGSLSYGYFNK